MNKNNYNRMSDKKQSIQDKINEIKSRKKLTDKEKFMKEMLDKSRRSNNQSKMKITLSNDIDSLKEVCWIMSNELMKYTLINGDDMILINNESFDKILCMFDEIFINYWEQSGTAENTCELHNIFFTIDIWEDLEVENCEVYKRVKIYDNVNIVFGALVVYDKLELNEIFDKDIFESGEEECEDIKNNFMKLVFDSMIKLEKMRVGKDCCCEECEENMKEISIKLTGNENKDRLERNNINKDNFDMCFTQREPNESIKDSVERIVKERQ